MIALIGTGRHLWCRATRRKTRVHGSEQLKFHGAAAREISKSISHLTRRMVPTNFPDGVLDQISAILLFRWDSSING